MVSSSAILRLVSLSPPLILLTSSNWSFCSWFLRWISSFSWKNSTPIRFSILFWFSSRASTRMPSLARFSPSSPRVGRLKDLGEPTFFLVEMRFLLRLSLMSREETALLTEAASLLSSAFCWHFSRKLSSICTSFWFSIRKERSDIIICIFSEGQRQRECGYQMYENQWKQVTWLAFQRLLLLSYIPFQTSTSPTDQLQLGTVASLTEQPSRLIVCTPWLVFTDTLLLSLTFVILPMPEQSPLLLLLVLLLLLAESLWADDELDRTSSGQLDFMLALEKLQSLLRLEKPASRLKLSSAPQAVSRQWLMESMELTAASELASPQERGAEGKGRPAVFSCRMRLICWLIFCCCARAVCRLTLATVSALFSLLKRTTAACREALSVCTVCRAWLPWRQRVLRKPCSCGSCCLRVLRSACVLLICRVSCEFWESRSVSCPLTMVMLALMASAALEAVLSCTMRPESWSCAFLRSLGLQAFWQEACWALICALMLAICCGTVKLRETSACRSELAWAIFPLSALICAWSAAICALQSLMLLSMVATFWSRPATLFWRRVMLPLRTRIAWLACEQLCDCELRLLLMVWTVPLTSVICFLRPSWLFKATLSCCVSPRPVDLAELIWPLSLVSCPLRDSSCPAAPVMADCMFLTLFSCWVMEMASCCWLVTAPLREEVKEVMSVCAFCLLAEPCRIISSRLAMVWLTSVCWLKRAVMLRSYYESALTAWLPFWACAVAMLRTAVLGTWLGSWPVTITEVGQEEMFLEAVEMSVQSWLYCVTRLLTAFMSELPETLEEEVEEEEEEVEGLEIVPMLMAPVLALRLKPSELPKLQLTPFTVSTCAPPEEAADEPELEEEDELEVEEEALVTVEMEEST